MFLNYKNIKEYLLIFFSFNFLKISISLRRKSSTSVGSAANLSSQTKLSLQTFLISILICRENLAKNILKKYY